MFSSYLVKTKQLLKHLWVKIFIVFLFIIGFLNCFFSPQIKTHYSTIITDTNGEMIHAFLSSDDKWRMFVELKEITPTLKKAILAKEDKYFYYHFGVNPAAIFRAIFNNITQGKRTSGASTLTMQVARMLEPKNRTYFNKILEILRAIQLEIFYSKEEILQLYLNLVPYGSNIEGVKSASYLYFQKSPDRLSLAEVITLAIIPNRPTSLKLGTKNPLIVQERNKWLMKFKQEGVFENHLIDDALNEPLLASRHESPKNAPHLAIYLKEQFTEKPIICSSIKKATQANVEQMVYNYINRMRALQINNAAVLVINNQTMQIEAYVGSAGFDDKLDAGQVDGVQAIRSPGSALKPLLYATCFDEGIITPKNMLNDVPTNFNGFEPENFDKKFNGKVSAEFALANSLNIPAVKLMQDLGKQKLIEQLKKADFQTIKKQEKELGLSIVLGGCGVTLKEMTQLYATFANEGKWSECTALKGKNIINKLETSHLISTSAAYLTTTILAQIKRPDLPNNFDYTYRLPKIAWKTGTSFGKRDAWSIGYNKKYTIGVWVGNFSGVGVPELSGAEIATPLLFQIFNIIDYNSSNSWFQEPQELIKRQVCAESGDLPSDFCSNKILDFAIKNKSHTRKCIHLKKFFVNHVETISYCTQCLPIDGNYKEKFYTNNAPELTSYYESKHIIFDKIPRHNPTCTRFFSNQANELKIINPRNGSEYFINKIDKQQLQLACQTANDANEVYWYVNDQLLQKSLANKPVFFSPPLGHIKISCTDNKGRSTSIWIDVKEE